MKREKLKLYLITDSEILRERDFYKAIEEALKAGVKTVQLREKNELGGKFLEKAIKLRELTLKYNALLIINDRVDIAILSNADGVHVGQKDIDAKSVRKLIGYEKIVGVSAGSIQEAKRAKDDGANYIGVGAIFKTNTKKDAKNTGIEVLRDIKEKISIPIVAIGGIKEENIETLKDINVDGYAIISDILGASNIEEKTKRILDLI